MVSVHTIGNSSTNYQMTWYLDNNYDRLFVQSQGYIFGNKLTVSINAYNVANVIAVFGINHNVRVGNQVTYTILNNMSFIDEAGQIWTWDREY